MHDQDSQEQPEHRGGGTIGRRAFLTAVTAGVGLGATALPGLATADVDVLAVAGWSNPTLGRLTSGYKTPERPTHTGWDVANDQGTPVYALAAGTVRDIRTGSYPGDPTYGPLPGRTGNSVHINHANSYFSYYGHLYTVLVSPGQRIACGQLVGLMGATGQATGPHLHFEIHRPRLTTLNPRTFLSDRGIALGSTAPVGTTGWPAYSQGVTTWRVKVAQHLLNARGYGLLPDGYFGAVTTNAVKDFQRRRGLYVDGQIGPITWTALILPARQGDSGNIVKGVQEALNAYGYGLLVDGGFGTVTDTAVKNFQSSHGLYADGDVGPLTWCTLI